MHSRNQRTTVGKHRKMTSSRTITRRVALAAVATGTVSTAGIGGATAATLQAQADVPVSTEAAHVNYELAGNASQLSSSVAETAPQILAISEYKPVTNLDDQLATAVEYNTQRAEADKAAHAQAAATTPAAAGASAPSASGSVVKPTEGTLTSGYEMRWGSMHSGLDIANAIGTPIRAVMDGTVISSGPASGYGNWVRIQHDDGSVSLYGHMATLNVAVGERVTAGQQIAGMGNEGFSTGSHLHFELHPGGGAPVDPAPWFAEHGITFS